MTLLGAAHDPRTTASRLAVDRALAWYLDEVPAAKAPPLPGPDALALRGALAGHRAWAAEQFDHLVTFAQAMHRLAALDAKVPACNLGDAITALNALITAPEGPRWSFEPAVDAEAFAKLEFREASVGIARAQREHREGWWAHGQKNRAFIEAAAATCPRTDLAVVLGAGHAFDLPLAALARRFRRLVLVDIDGEALAATAAALARELGGAGASVETQVVDLTGVNAQLVRRIEEVVRGPEGTGPAEAARALDGLLALCRSYRLPTAPRLAAPAPGAAERADLLVSSCVLNQLAWPQRVFAERCFEARFGPLPAPREHAWSAAWTELGLRIQQDHLNALGDAADTVALTSDVVNHPTTWDARAGAERPTGRKIYALGVESLLERIPRFYKTSAQARWKWSRYQASRKGGEGSTMDVDGLVLGEPRSAGGLWLPSAT